MDSKSGNSEQNFYKLNISYFVDEDGIELTPILILCDDELLEWSWRQGVPFENSPEVPLKMEIDPNTPSNSFFSDYLSSPVPLISLRFAEVLKNAGVKNLVTFPVEVKDAENWPDFPGYVAFNIEGTGSIADPQKSSEQKAFGMDGATLFQKLTPQSELNTKLSIFRASEQLSTILVSEDIKSRCEAAEIDTLEFLDL